MSDEREKRNDYDEIAIDKSLLWFKTTVSKNKSTKYHLA